MEECASYGWVPPNRMFPERAVLCRRQLWVSLHMLEPLKAAVPGPVHAPARWIDRHPAFSDRISLALARPAIRPYNSATT
jgi:hypothetical protein